MLTGTLRTALLVVAGLLAGTAGAFAQATGTIAGTVTDESGALLPGATVEATNRGTNQARSALTGTDGFYTLPLLPPGVYNVRVSLTGFGTLLRQDVRVTVAETTRITVSLTVGSIAEQVTVGGATPLVETANATLGVVIDEKKVVDLPLNGRNFTQLGTLIPGVVAPPVALGGQSGDATPGGFGNVTGGFSVNGQRNQSNNFLLDGATNNDTFNTGFVLRPPPDAIQEFKILTHSYNAEYGRNAGSVVNVVTKSGTNEWHGSVWEFNRDDALEARNFFAPKNQPKPTLKQNQFGASLGGPIAKDKLFGFAYYEGFRNTRGTTTNMVVLTEAQRAGDFSGGPPIRDPLTGQPFPDNLVPANRLDPIAQRLLRDFVPAPNSAGNRYIVSPELRDTRDQFGLRVDYALSDRNLILARYLRSETEVLTPRIVTPIDQRSGATLQDFMLSNTHTFSPNAINVTRVSLNKIAANPQVTSGLSNAEYGFKLPNTNPAAVGLPSILVPGFFNNVLLGDLQQPFVERRNDVLQISSDFSYLRGRHAFKLGFDARREKMFIAFINRPNGDFTFNGTFTGNAAADFLLGLPAQFRGASPGADPINEGEGWSYSGYVQDEIRLSPRLTVNVGLRYELFQPFVDSGDALNSFRPGEQSQRFPQAPSGLVYPGDPGVPRGTYETDKNNVAPRLAVVWDPFGKGRTSLRAAWGIFYDSLPGQGDFFQNTVLAPPFNPLLELNAPPLRLTTADPLGAASGGPAGFPPGIIFIGWGRDFETPDVHHYNLTVQQQIGDNLGVELGYVGSRGYNLPIFMEVNPGVVVPGQTTRSARLYPAFSLVRPTFTVARSWYDSLQTSFRLRPTGGLNFLASYTWSHAIDHISGLNIANPEQPRPMLPVVIGDRASIDAALARERGDALFDVRHRFVFSFGLELPKLEDQTGLVRHLLGGWQLNGIFQAQTGFPLTVIDPVTDIRFLTNRPDVTCDPNAGPKTAEKWFTTECFSRLTLAETNGRQGNEGRNGVRGPGFSRTDLSLFKNIGFADRHRLQLRIEAFNVLNQTRFGQPGDRIGTPTFGRITAAEEGRIVQLGVKYSF